jgi:2-methylcitrate dehydratase PrpD
LSEVLRLAEEDGTVSPTATLGRYIAEATFADIPEDVVIKAKRCILDSIACAFGGYACEPGRKVADSMKSLEGRADATIIGSGKKVSLPNAALANTYNANILDYDDTYTSHPGCTVIHPALGGGENDSRVGEGCSNGHRRRI